MIRNGEGYQLYKNFRRDGTFNNVWQVQEQLHKEIFMVCGDGSLGLEFFRRWLEDFQDIGQLLTFITVSNVQGIRKRAQKHTQIIIKTA